MKSHINVPRVKVLRCDLYLYHLRRRCTQFTRSIKRSFSLEYSQLQKVSAVVSDNNNVVERKKLSEIIIKKKLTHLLNTAKLLILEPSAESWATTAAEMLARWMDLLNWTESIITTNIWIAILSYLTLLPNRFPVLCYYFFSLLSHYHKRRRDLHLTGRRSTAALCVYKNIEQIVLYYEREWTRSRERREQRCWDKPKEPIFPTS